MFKTITKTHPLVNIVYKLSILKVDIFLVLRKPGSGAEAAYSTCCPERELSSFNSLLDAGYVSMVHLHWFTLSLFSLFSYEKIRAVGIWLRAMEGCLKTITEKKNIQLREYKK